MKDPAFLFYSSDFLTGTMLMTDEQVGKYIRLLCLQHQKGHLLKEHMINICKSYDKDIFDKFRIDENGLYYNERLRIEIEKRSKYCESRRANRISANKDNHMSEHMSTHMYTHMENENENINKENGVRGEKQFKNPTLEEVKQYFHENGYSEQSAITAFEYYEAGGWIDARGKKVRNWKQKMISVWFKQDNKISINAIPTAREVYEKNNREFSF